MNPNRSKPHFFAARPGAIVLLALGTAVGIVAFAMPAFPQAPGSPIERALQSLTAGDTGGLVALFRYFDESVGTAEASKDRSVIARFFALLEEHFGRPGTFGRIVSTARRYFNVHIESANPDLWRNSECVFKTYAYQATFVRGTQRRLADVLIEVCLDPRLRPTSVKKLDVRFVNPDRDTIQQGEVLFERLRAEIEKIRGPRT